MDLAEAAGTDWKWVNRGNIAKEELTAGDGYSPAFRLAERTMGPGSCLCPARAALPVPLGPPLARVPCPSPFPEPRGAGAPGGAGS